MVPVFHGAGAERIKQSRVTDIPLVQALDSSCPGICTLTEAGEVDVNQPIVDRAQHLKSVVESALFKTVPFQVVEQRLYCTIPGVLSLWLLHAYLTARCCAFSSSRASFCW